MGAVFGIIFGIIIGIILFYWLLKNGHLKELNIPELFPSMERSSGPGYGYSAPRKKEPNEYDEFISLLETLELSRDYDAELSEPSSEYNRKISELQRIRDSGKSEVDTARQVAITAIEKEYENAQRLRNKTRSDADNEWSKQTDKRDKDKNAARNEFNKKVEEIDREWEKNRAELYKKKNDADAIYTKDQETFYANKTKAQNLASTKKGEIDTAYYASAKIFEKEKEAICKKIRADRKKEILSKLTVEQKEKYKNYI